MRTETQGLVGSLRLVVAVVVLIGGSGYPTQAHAADDAGGPVAPGPHEVPQLPPPPTVPPDLRPAGSPFAVDVRVDLPLTLGLGVLSLAAEVVKGELAGPACAQPAGAVCDATGMNALDRTVIGMHSASARTASDVLLGVGLGLPLALNLIDVLSNRPRDGMAGYAKDALILVEVALVNAGLNAAFKYAVRRPRPFTYDPDYAAVPASERAAADAGLSFYSQHSSTAFALATAYSYLFMLRHPGSRLIAPVWILTEGLAASTAVLRVFAGKHFWTDVLTGAAVGVATGLVVPLLHRRLPAGSAAGASAAWARHIVASPMVLAGGAGLLVSLE